MNITDELREYIRKHTLRWANPEHPSGGSCSFDPQTSPDMLRAIADRIDAEHERQLGVLYRDMSDAEWVRLPKDADNVPWNVGDCDEDGNEVTELRLTSSGWCVLTDDEWPYRPERHRHHHAPNVEDVLREMLDAWGELPSNVTNEAIIAEYAKRLTLADGEDA